MRFLNFISVQKASIVGDENMPDEVRKANNKTYVQKTWFGGCFVSKISKSDLLYMVNKWIAQGQKNKYITAINVSKFIMIQKDKKLSDFVLNSEINIADGFPIYLAARMVGDPIPERITGVDLMEDLLQLANNNEYKVYFLGSKPHVLDGVLNKCLSQYPNLKIAGSRNGYFKKDEVDSIVRVIASASPDILLVALGLPQKEYFIDDYGSSLNSSVILPVGGAFDIYAGVKKRAPFWVQKLGIEWLWRSIYDRSRAGLIFKSFISFSFILFSEIFRQRILKKNRR
jgi:N-acetylglucosaminyldiphosphoundecaprenol N-acetyl-beta-D-mannosaminyltransferase